MKTRRWFSKCSSSHLFLKTGEGVIQLPLSKRKRPSTRELNSHRMGETKREETNCYKCPVCLFDPCRWSSQWHHVPTLVGATIHLLDLLWQNIRTSCNPQTCLQKHGQWKARRKESQRCRGVHGGVCVCTWGQEGGAGKRSWKPDLLKGPEGFWRADPRWLQNREAHSELTAHMWAIKQRRKEWWPVLEDRGDGGGESSLELELKVLDMGIKGEVGKECKMGEWNVQASRLTSRWISKTLLRSLPYCRSPLHPCVIKFTMKPDPCLSGLWQGNGCVCVCVSGVQESSTWGSASLLFPLVPGPHFPQNSFSYRQWYGPDKAERMGDAHWAPLLERCSTVYKNRNTTA